MPEPQDWGTPLDAAICEQCDWRYLLPPGLLPLQCPHCFGAVLVSLNGQGDALPHDHPPELVLPFTAATATLSQQIQQFAGHIWFAPGDLNPENLKTRLQRVYLPMWLVDSQVQATWHAEVGFNYQVVSHRDSFDENSGGWQSQQVKETRIRWEPRVGRLTRTYHNIPAPALEEHDLLLRRLGQYNLSAAQAYSPAEMEQAIVRLPNRSPTDAWPDAAPAFKEAAAKECRQAAHADHLREFRWRAEHPHQNWTLLLLPMYVTYYLDDDRTPQPILIHGQTGQLSGPRRASMKRAQRTALIIVAVAAVIFALSLVAGLVSFFVPPLFVVAAVGVFVAVLVGLLGLVPVGIAWQFNRSHRQVG